MHALKLLLTQSNTLRSLDTVHDNIFWRGAAPRLSVCVPTDLLDVTPLMQHLSDARCAGLIEMIVLDDGGCDHDLLARMQAAAGQARLAVRIVAAHDKRGLAAARSAAAAHARADWLLFLDANMAPDTPGFIETYLDVIDRVGAPALVVGGSSLRTDPRDPTYALERWLARRLECLPASIRERSPAHHVSCANAVVHRSVLATCPFDEGFGGPGRSDAAWGMRLEGRFPVLHIDNPASRLGATTTAALMSRHAGFAGDLKQLAQRHPATVAAMPLYQSAQRWRSAPFRSSFKRLAAVLARNERLPVALRGPAFEAWVAIVLAETL